MDGLAIAASVHELRLAAEGATIRTIHQPLKRTYILQVLGHGTRRILIDPCRAAIHLTALDLANPLRPDPFIMLLRRHLRGARICAIRQREWDRVVTLDIERREGRSLKSYQLLVELTGSRGNLVLVGDGKVLRTAFPDQRNRPGGGPVLIQPQGKIDPAKLSEVQLRDILAAGCSARSLVQAIDGIGQSTANDLLGNRPGDGDGTDSADAKVIHGALRTMLSCVEHPSPRVALEGRATFYPLPPPAAESRTFWEALDVAFAAQGEDDCDRAEDRGVRSDLLREISRRKRTLERLRERLAEGDDAERLQSDADLLMIHHTRIPRRAEQIEAADPMTGLVKSIGMDPRLTAIENAQRLYRRAKRLRRGRAVVIRRIGQLAQEMELLEQAVDAVEAGLEISGEASALLPKARSKVSYQNRSRLDRRLTMDGYTILVGKSAKENDRLLRSASPNDLWFHAKGVAGSHVIIKRHGREDVPDAIVRRAARLAARHSKLRGERKVEVLQTEVKHVRKPKGAAPGLVNVLRSDTLTVEP